MKKICLLALSMALSHIATAKSKSVLFIGNSYVHTNDMPLVLQQLAASNNDTLTYSQNTPGGSTLQGHSADPATLNLIKSKAWDFVVIQEQSQRPAFSPGQVATQVMPFAKRLDSLVQANNACTQTMYMMTWGYVNGDASNCGNYPPICTYAGMQAGLRNSYLQMTIYNYANVAPIGAAWKVIRDSFPAIDLYSPDGSHPSMAGTYLGACVFYASIFHKNPLGSSYFAGLNTTDAKNLQRIAAKVALDSLETWQQSSDLSYANFSYSKVGNTVTFQNKSQRGNNYLWDFGDGTTATTSSPVKTYANAGIYTVTLKANNSCNSDVMAQSINLFSTSIPSTVAASAKPFIVTNSGAPYLQLPQNNSYNKLEVFDLTGRRIAVQLIDDGTQKIALNYNTGMYIFRLSGVEGIFKDKFIIQ